MKCALTLRTSALVFAAAAVALAPPAPVAAAQSGETRILLDRDLRAREIQVLSVTGDSIKYLDQQGRLRHAGVAGFVAMVPADGNDDRADAEQRLQQARGVSPGFIELTDGQRFPGELTPTGAEEDTVAWSHPAFGDVRFTLEQVARVVLDRAVFEGMSGASEIEGDAPVEDVLLLANGDRLDGFILSLGDPIEIETDGLVQSIPQDRVAAVRLANPASPLKGMVVWLDDGSVAVVASLDAEARRGVRLRLPSGADAETSLESLRAVAFSAGRLSPLASLDVVDQRPIDRRRLLSPVGPAPDMPEGAPPALRAPDLLIPGPMIVRYQLPEGARRFGAVAEMPLDALPWGDCELIVEIDGREELRIRLNDRRTRREFSIAIDPALGAQTLSIRLLPGAHGPVNDRIILRRPLLLVD